MLIKVSTSIAFTLISIFQSIGQNTNLSRRVIAADCSILEFANEIKQKATAQILQ